MIGKDSILLVGIGPFTNRGCEAIVRGTMAVLRREFGDDIQVTVATFVPPKVARRQQENERDPGITYVPLVARRWSLEWLAWQAKMRLYGGIPATYRELDGALGKARIALQLGGDTYSIDYGVPRPHLALDRYIWSCGVDVALWGASVGPFASMPRFEKYMWGHLGRMAGILVREPATFRYLREKGHLENVHRVIDPGFVMEPVRPDEGKIGFAIPEGAIGVSLSGLMAAYVTRGDGEAWAQRCVGILRSIVESTGRGLVLIPHCTTSFADDLAFLRRVLDRAPAPMAGKTFLVGDNLSAAEIKWVISKCSALIGARMHAIIAAVSTGVPTLALAYSVKARGMNEEIFGSPEYCLEPSEMTPEIVGARMKRLLENGDSISAHLRSLAPELSARAYAAGAILRSIIERRGEH